MNDRTLEIDGVEVPRFLYGTAWKEERTQRLTELALKQGFRGIGTANQRRHYYEAAVGKAIKASISGGSVTRDDLFLQTKFTFQRGQDHRLPYDPNAPIASQDEQSLASSLEQLQALCHRARVRPRFVQNRCYASRGWDRGVREFCAANELAYQGFSLLTANRDLLASSELVEIAKRHGRSVAQIIFRFAIQIGMIALTGTTNADHREADLDVFDLRLKQDEVDRIDRLGER